MSKKIDADTAPLSHSMVHYLLAIHKLKEERGYSRITDMAEDLGLSKGSVSIAINGLKKRGFVEEDVGGKFPVLTEKGHDEVHRILGSRTLIYYFLRDFVGIDAELADRDACQMEHLMSPETGLKFFEFMKDLSCTCERIEQEGGTLPERFRFKTALDLCKYDNAADFIAGQKGDSHLGEG